MCQQAREQPGENFLNETLNGKPFEFDEDLDVDPVEQLTKGIIELDFVTTRLAHEARYSFDLSKPMQHAKASKMLERKFLSAKAGDGSQGDQWRNTTLDKEPVNPHEWRVNITEEGNFQWRDEIQEDSINDSMKGTWRVPTKGFLEFDLITNNPMHLYSDHYRLNLANPKDRQLAESLRVSAALQPGENWWNETLNGYRFDLDEVISGESSRLPSRGILEFDVVMLAPQRGNMHMHSDQYKFDLSKPEQRECAVILRQRVLRFRLSQEEFWMRVHINGKPVPASIVWRAMWRIPTAGVMELDYVTFDDERRDMPKCTFELLIKALKCVGDRDKFHLLQSQSEGPNPYFITMEQVEKILGLFYHATVEQRMALEILLKQTRHAHQSLELLHSLCERDKGSLKNWALSGDWK